MVPKIFFIVTQMLIFTRRVSCKQLPNGNILICSGFQGRLFEIDYQTDSVVWDYIVPVNVFLFKVMILLEILSLDNFLHLFQHSMF